MDQAENFTQHKCSRRCSTARDQQRALFSRSRIQGIAQHSSSSPLQRLCQSYDASVSVILDAGTDIYCPRLCLFSNDERKQCSSPRESVYQQQWGLEYDNVCLLSAHRGSLGKLSLLSNKKKPNKSKSICSLPGRHCCKRRRT